MLQTKIYFIFDEIQNVRKYVSNLLAIIIWVPNRWAKERR